MILRGRPLSWGSFNENRHLILVFNLTFDCWRVQAKRKAKIEAELKITREAEQAKAVREAEEAKAKWDIEEQARLAAQAADEVPAVVTLERFSSSIRQAKDWAVNTIIGITTCHDGCIGAWCDHSQTWGDSSACITFHQLSARGETPPIPQLTTSRESRSRSTNQGI